MAQIIRRKNSPYWYARFRHRGKAYLISTETSNKAEARRFLETKLKEVSGSRTTEEAARAMLATMGIPCPAEDDAVTTLMRQLVLRAESERVASAFAEKIRNAETGAQSDPSARSALIDGRRRWARLIAGAQGTAVRLDNAWRAWEVAPRRRSASEDTVSTSYRPIWNRFEKWSTGRGLTHLHDVTPVDATEYMSHLQSENLSAKSIRNHRGFLVAVWNALKIQAGLSENVWAEIPSPEAPPSERRALDEDEIKRLFAAASDPEDHLAIALGLYAALRLGDVARLQWVSIRLDVGMIVLRPHKTEKYGREVKIPIHQALRALLVAQRAASPSAERVCPRLYRLYQSGRENAGRHVCGIFRQAGIRLVGDMTDRRQRAPSLGAFHALRHTFISYAARSGVPQAAVRAMVGHSNAATTRMYEHVDEATLRLAMDAIPLVSIAADARGNPGTST